MTTLRFKTILLAGALLPATLLITGCQTVRFVDVCKT